MGLDALPPEFFEKINKRLRPRDSLSEQGFGPRDRPGDYPKRCQGCYRTANLRECWGCKNWFCYDCLIEHMIGCPEWLAIKNDFDVIFECNKHEACDDCPLRFKCYTSKKIPKKK